MVSFENYITIELEHDLKGRSFPPIELKELTDGSNIEEINENLTRILSKLNEIDRRFEYMENAIINAIDELETNKKGPKLSKEVNKGLRRQLRLR